MRVESHHLDSLIFKMHSRVATGRNGQRLSGTGSLSRETRCQPQYHSMKRYGDQMEASRSTSEKNSPYCRLKSRKT